MTDFDFEILAAISLYGAEGVERKTLEREHFPNYSLDYNLAELAKPQVELRDLISMKITWDNAAYVKVRIHKAPALLADYIDYQYFSLTDKGRALLHNWQRQKKVSEAAARRAARINWLISFAVGVVSGLAASFIYAKLLQQ